MKRALLIAACAALAACSSPARRLMSDVPLVRSEALEAASRAGEKKKRKIVAAVKKHLADKDPARRTYAASALEDIGPEAADAAPELMSALFDSDTTVALSAERSLIKLKGAAPAMAAALASEDARLRAKAASILIAQGDPGALALAANFQKGSKQLAIESIVTLARMGPGAEKAVPALARAASSPDPEVKTLAASALSDVGRPAGLWLAAALRSANARARAGAAFVLASMPVPPPETLEALTYTLEDTDAAVRANSAIALAGFSPEAMSSLPGELLPPLQRAAAAGYDTTVPALIALARTGRAEGKYLVSALDSSDARAREAAALALILTFPPPPQPAGPLLEALKDPEQKVRRAAAAALGNYAITRPESLPKDSADKLSAALADPDARTRDLAVLPLGRLALSDEKAMGALISGLASPEPETRLAVIAALASAGAKAAAAEPPLWDAFRAADCRQKTAAAKALAAIKPELRRLPAVARALKLSCQPGAAAPDLSLLPGLAPGKPAAATAKPAGRKAAPARKKKKAAGRSKK